MQYIVGKYYLVPTVYGQFYHMRAHWPVIGPKHEDAEILNFPLLHYHIDWRFVPQQLFSRSKQCHISLFPASQEQLLLGSPLHESDRKNQTGLPAPSMRRLLCKREFAPYPRVKFGGALEKKFAGCRLKQDHICPHRGVPLGSLPRDENGAVQCPAHGLRWNLRTGELVCGEVA